MGETALSEDGLCGVEVDDVPGLSVGIECLDGRMSQQVVDQGEFLEKPWSHGAK